MPFDLLIYHPYARAPGGRNRELARGGKGGKWRRGRGKKVWIDFSTFGGKLTNHDQNNTHTLSISFFCNSCHAPSSFAFVGSTGRCTATNFATKAAAGCGTSTNFATKAAAGCGTAINFATKASAESPCFIQCSSIVSFHHGGQTTVRRYANRACHRGKQLARSKQEQPLMTSRTHLSKSPLTYDSKRLTKSST